MEKKQKSCIYKACILIRGQKHNRHIICLETEKCQEKNETAIVNNNLEMATREISSNKVKEATRVYGRIITKRHKRSGTSDSHKPLWK